MLPWKDNTNDNSEDETLSSRGEAEEECFGRRETALQVIPLGKRDKAVLQCVGSVDEKNRIYMAKDNVYLITWLAQAGPWSCSSFFSFNVIPVPTVNSPSHNCFNDQCILKSNTSRLIDLSPLTSPHKISFKTVVIIHEASKDS